MAFSLAHVGKHVEKLHARAKHFQNKVEEHKDTIGAVVEHAAYQAEGIAAAGLAALADHYLGSNGQPFMVAGIPVVGLAGVAAGGVSLALGKHPAAGHLAAVAVAWEAIGTYDLVSSALANMNTQPTQPTGG